MTSRNSLLAILTVLLAAIGALGVMAGLAQPAEGFGGPPPERSVVEPTFSRSEPGGVAEGVFTGGPVAAAEAPADTVPEAERRDDGTIPTHGRVRGEVSLSAEIAPEIRRVTVRLQEARNWNGNGPQPYAVTQGITVDRSTPRFEFHQVPLTEHGYTVEAFAPGANGSVTHTRPTVEEPARYVRLTLTEPVPFTVMLRDQFRNPVTDVAVAMLPEGKPLGRPAKRGTADNTGSVRFDGVLAGDYTIEVGMPGNLLVEPVAVNVQRPGITVLESKAVNHQHKLVEVPVGVPLTVTVAQRNGWMLADAQVEVLKLNTRQLLERRADSGADGKASFPHMPAGDYRVHVHKAGFQRVTRTLTIGADDQDAVLQVELVRLR